MSQNLNWRCRLARPFCWLLAAILHLHILLNKCALNVVAWSTKNVATLLAIAVLILSFAQLLVGVECTRNNNNSKGLPQIVELDRPSLLDAARETPVRSPSRPTGVTQQANGVRLDSVALKLSAKTGSHFALQSSSGDESNSAGLANATPPRILRRTRRDLTKTAPPPPTSNESYLGRLSRKIKQAILPERNYFRLVRRLHSWFWAHKKLQQVALDSGAIEQMKSASELFKEEYARVDHIFLTDKFYQQDRNLDSELEEGEQDSDSLSASETSSLNSDEEDGSFSSSETDSYSELEHAHSATMSDASGDGWLNLEEETGETLQEECTREPSYDANKVESMDFLYRVLSAVVARLEARLEELKLDVAASEVKKREATLKAERNGVMLDVGSAQFEDEQLDPADKAISRSRDEPMSQEQIASAMARAKRIIIKEAKSFAKNELLSLASVVAYKGLALYVSGLTVSDPMIVSNLIEPLLYFLGGASTPLAVRYLRDIEIRAALGVVNRIKPIPAVTCTRSEYAKLKATNERNKIHLKVD